MTHPAACYDGDTRLAVALGDDGHEGPKLSIKVVILAGLILILFSLWLYGLLPASESQRGGDLVYLIATIAFCLVLQHEYQPRLWQFGLSREVLRSRRTLAWIGLGIALAGANFGFIYGVVSLGSVMGPPHHVPTLGLLPTGRILGQPFDLLVDSLIGPFLEELLFRGYLYLVFRQNWGQRWAALISSAVFAACHLWSVLFAVEVFLGSLVDIYLDNKARSLAPSIAGHALYNLVLRVIRFSHA